jgi:hypothetical protein
MLHQHGMTRMKDVIYLEIISKFSEYCFLVYVRGLGQIPDILLKWLAEYTKHNP